MLFWTLLVVIAVVCATATKILEEDFHQPAIRASMIEEINAMQTTWKAVAPVRFSNATVADVKRMLGTILPGEEGYEAPELVKVSGWATDASTLPTNFDARTADKWANCADVIGRVRDQSNCGSCWAFGSTEAFNDRHCIATGKKTIFSAEDTLACCSGAKCGGSMGCNGGQPSGAWKFFISTGVSTGGDWADVNTGATCKPYNMESCAHHVSPPDNMKSCEDISSYKTPSCSSSCTDKGYGTAYKNDKFFAKTSYSVKKSESAIQQEIYDKGTVSVALTVYEDFEVYSSGVYKHVSGKKLGGHAVKMVGWGVTADGVKYWTCINSWNKYWGEGGAFRILRGVDECGIESSIVAGDV